MNRSLLAPSLAPLLASILLAAPSPTTSAATAAATPASPIQFNRDIRPLLSDNCFACHGPDSKKVKGGLRLDIREHALKPAKSGKLAIVPGKPGESELIQRILATDEEDLMPPKESHKSLTPAQKQLLQDWIASGAEYQGHWAYLPPQKPSIPPHEHPIDYLVRKRLASQGLQPSPPADRRTLARRLSWDLTGLPARPADIDSLEKSTHPNALSERIDALLASPHYGERLAQFWLDAARFADTIGYHSDNPRNIWPYRDYVIRSFQSNKPFDQFTREQLAGDLLPNPTLDQRVGSAFNRLLLSTEEGGAQPKDYEARMLTDRVRAVGSVWLGQTLGCSQCHDHKFDPVTMRDFYSMGAFFADIKETIIGRREDGILVPSDDQAAQLSSLDAQLAALQKQLDGPHPSLQAERAQWEAEQIEAAAQETLWTSLKPSSARSAQDAKLNIRENASILASGKRPDTDRYEIAFTNTPPSIVGLRLDALPDDSLPSKGPGRANNGNFVLTEISARISHRTGAETPLRFKSAIASHEQSTLAQNNPYGAWNAASAIDGDAKGSSWGWAILPGSGKPHALALALADTAYLQPGDRLVVELYHHHGNGNHTLGHFRISAASSHEATQRPPRPASNSSLFAALQTPAAVRTSSQQAALHAAFVAQSPNLAPLREKLAAAKKARADFENALPKCIVSVSAESPRTVRILPRGDWMNETGEIMRPAFPAYIQASYQPAANRPLSRLDLAEWLLSPDHPLTARVFVNRLWKQFFGAGLSKVLDDFGAQGEPPLNPELLDWLACEFRDSGWNVKHMVRLIALSQTYQQSSAASKEALARDPYNREWARQSRWRLDAEFVRDAALSISGLLVPKIGGPSVKPYQPDGYWENLNFPTRNYDASNGDDQYRRGLYTWWQRSFLHPSLLAFDAPSREECAADRTRSNIPQQALVLLNDPSYVEAAKGLALRIQREASGAPADRIRWAWSLAVGRSPRPEESATLVKLFEKHLAEFQSNPEAVAALLKTGQLKVPAAEVTAETAAWMNVARVLLNLHETITRS